MIYTVGDKQIIKTKVGLKNPHKLDISFFNKSKNVPALQTTSYNNIKFTSFGIMGDPETPRTSQHYGMEGFDEDLYCKYTHEHISVCNYQITD